MAEYGLARLSVSFFGDLMLVMLDSMPLSGFDKCGNQTASIEENVHNYRISLDEHLSFKKLRSR